MRKEFYSKIILIMVYGISFLQPCLAASDRKRLMQTPSKTLYQLEELDSKINSVEEARIFAIANLLRCSAANTMGNLQHPLKVKLFEIFQSFIDNTTNAENTLKTIEDIYSILYRKNDKYTTFGWKTKRYFFRIFLELYRELTNIDSSNLKQDYMREAFLYDNYILEEFYSEPSGKHFICLMCSYFFKAELLIQNNSKQKFGSTSTLTFDNLYPKYFYSMIEIDDGEPIEHIDLDKKYKFTHIDDFKSAEYVLIGFITEEGGKVYSYIKEDGKWKKFLNNREIEDFSLQPVCPVVVLFEKVNETKLSSK